MSAVDTTIAPVVEAPAAEPVVESTEPVVESSTEPEIEIEGTHDSGGGKSVAEVDVHAGQDVPKTWTSALAEIKKTNPTLAKEIRDSYFRNKQLTEAFPDDAPGTDHAKSGVQKAIEARDTLDLANDFTYKLADGTPLTGLDAYKRHVQDINNFDQLFLTGDAKFSQTLVEANPEAASKQFVNMINEMRRHPETVPAYNRAMSKVVYNTLAGKDSQVYQSIQAAGQALQAGKSEDALAYIQRVWNWLGSLEDAAGAETEEEINPERVEYQKKLSDLDQQKNLEFRVNVGRKVLSQRDALIKDNLTALAKATNRTLTEGQLKRLGASVVADIEEKMRNDEKYNTDVTAIFATKNADRALKFVMGKASPLVLEYAKTAFADMFGTATAKSGGKSSATTSGGKAPTGTQMLTRKPEKQQIDWGRTSNDMLVDRQVYLIGKPGLFTWRTKVHE